MTHEVSTQTDYDGVHNIAASLDLKLKSLEKYYSNRVENSDSKLSFEEKIMAYQKQIELKIKQEYEDKMRAFKELEVGKIRNEEREKLRIETQVFRAELDHNYQKRHEALRLREQALEDMSKQRREIEDRDLFLQRQKLLDEMKLMREQESEFKKNIEWRARISTVDMSKQERLEEAVKKRETAVKLAEEELDIRLRNEREKIKLDLERNFSQRQFVLDSIEARNRQEATQNEVERANIDRLRHEFQAQQVRLAELELEAQKAKGEAICLKQENALHLEKLSHCIDYEFIVNENKLLRHKLDLSKEIIGEKSLSRRAKSRNSSIHESIRDVVASGNSHKDKAASIDQNNFSINERLDKIPEKDEPGSNRNNGGQRSGIERFSLNEQLQKMKERNAINLANQIVKTPGKLKLINCSYWQSAL